MELENLVLKKEIIPTVYIQDQWIQNQYTGEVYGKYIANTQSFNILSTEPKADLALIGCIYQKEPYRYERGKYEKTPHAIGYYVDGELTFIESVNGKPCNKEIYSIQLDIFSRNSGILESSIMSTKGAVILGCGSVGSLFALELARAGVGRFFLIDNDILGYHNICRHQCGVYDVGKYKTDAVKERILQINPSAEVITQNRIIQEVPLDLLDQFCNEDTILIGCADNREGDLYGNQIAQEKHMPLMSVGFWERAFAGEIFYCLPNDMPNYADFVAALGDMSGRVTMNRRFYTNEQDLERVSFEPGISVDINFVTTIAIKLAIDILNINNPEYIRKVYDNLTQYTLVCNTNDTRVGGEGAEIFSYPLQVTTSILVPYADELE